MVETKTESTSLPDTSNSQESQFSAGGRDWTRFVAFGTAAGIVIGESDLEVAIVRVRPNGVSVVAHSAIVGFRKRGAADWGREYRDFLQKNGEKHLSATVLLPRRDVIVRLAPIPGVQKKDILGALTFQIDSLHPFGDEPVDFAYAKAGANDALVGIVRRSTLEQHVNLFAAAGVAVSGFTFSASAVFAALRVFGPVPKDFVLVNNTEDGLLEIYGESSSKSVFSAEFDLAPARAISLAYSELRLTAQNAPLSLAAALPTPRNVIPVDVLAYAVALAPLARWKAQYANLLPANRRTVHSRIRFIPTVVLAVMLLSVGIAWLVYVGIRDQRYLEQLHTQISRVQATANRAESVDRLTADRRSRVALLDSYRKRTQGDIEILAELSRIIPTNVWTNNIDIGPDSVTLTGEADQAAPLLKILDSSPYFRNSEFSMSVMKGGANGEAFRIRTFRKAMK